MSHANCRNFDLLSLNSDSVHFLNSCLSILNMCILNKSKAFTPSSKGITIDLDVLNLAELAKQFLQSLLLYVGKGIYQTAHDHLH